MTVSSGAGVVDGGEAVAGVGAAVEEGLEVDGGDGAVTLDAGFEDHLDGMAAAMAVEDLFATESELDGAAVAQGEERGGEVVGERLALAAEAAANGRDDHAQAAARNLQHFGDLAVDVVRGLGGGPER